MNHGRIVAHAVSPHTPRMANPDGAPDFLSGVIDGAREMGEAIRSLEPDLWVVHSAHWVTTFNWYVTHQARHDGMCVGEECPDLIPGIDYSIQGHPEFAAALSTAIEKAGFPGGQSRTSNHRFDYGSYVPLVYLDPEFSLPVVLLGCCVMADIGECMAVGAAVVQAAKESGRRIAFLASTALSHRLVRGPDRWPSDNEQKRDHAFIDLLCSGQVQQAQRQFPDYAKAVMAEMGGRNLATFLGTLDNESQYHGRQYGSYGQSSGSGNVSILLTESTE